MRLYRGLSIPYDPTRLGQEARQGQGTNFTDCAFTALRYAAGRRGEVLVVEVPDEAGTRVSEELWPGAGAKRLMVWGRIDDLVVATIPAKEPRAEVNRGGVAGRGSSYKRWLLERTIAGWLADRQGEFERVLAARRSVDRTGKRSGTGRRKDRLSTSTLGEGGALVPWLAASGPLAYTPESPPERDYYYQYSWVVPGIFADGVNLREHHWFGAQHKEAAHDLFAFWRRAREGRIERVAYRSGRVEPESVTAPLAVYSLPDWDGTPRYLLMQHGSYQLVKAAEQPLLADGMVLLYRGLERAEAFRWPPFTQDALDDAGRLVWRRYLAVQGHVLSDSVRSFNSIHDRAKRCETSHLRDGTWLTDDLAEEHGLDIEHGGLTESLWRQTHQSFSLASWVAKNKFGPHYVVLKTPLDNIRITTLVAGEHEARIVDPGRVEVVEAHGCRHDDEIGSRPIRTAS